jgi:hypothetical protein
MTPESVKDAVAEAERFLKKYKEWEEVQGQTYGKSNYPLSTPTENAALKRSSMDLTKALAKMRKPV